MILKMFSILDTKAGMFSTPFFFAASGQAIRACIDLASDMSTSVARHPADYTLFELGTWDDATATFAPAAPINHGVIVSMIPAPRQASLINFPTGAELRQGEM